MPAQSRSNPLSAKLFAFVRDLTANNRREWFQVNKDRYEDDVVDPSLQFVSLVGEKLRKVSPHINAIPTKSGGSLFRIYRDTRFGKDKTPYKTHVGIRFPHSHSKNVHAPSYYLHLDPKGSFFGFGVWHPEAAALQNIRQAIDANPAAWKRVRNAKKFTEQFQLEGDSLKTAPKGFDRDHPMIEDLRRKDFIAVRRLTQKEVLATDFVESFTTMAKAGAPFMSWLCGALDVPWSAA